MNKEEQHLSLYKDHKDTILEAWLKELTENPRFSSETFKNKRNLSSYSNSFLNQVLSALDHKKIPDFSKEKVEPVLTLWHHIIKDQTEGDFSTKDTAVLIYALKTSLVELVNQAKTEQDKEELLKLEQVLDILGILTFEMYSVENEKLISRQSQQIQYLQTHNLELDGKMIGSSLAINEVYKAIGLVLENDLTVLLEGESGTGKDLIATMIHSNSNRNKKPFVAINCGAIPRELIESELFGHEKGAFTGAVEQRIGRFEQANGGTLFLDEIGDMPLETQTRLLRVLSNKEFFRVGGDKPIKVDVRILAATHQSLETLVASGSFREDLFYRLNVIRIDVPPLRKRKEDIGDLSTAFLKRHADSLMEDPKILSPEALLALTQYDWPGNVRQLENTCYWIALMAPTQNVKLEDLPNEIINNDQSPDLQDDSWQAIFSQWLSEIYQSNSENMLAIIEPALDKVLIEFALKKTGGKKQDAAKVLGLGRNTLSKKIKAQET